MGKEDLLSSEKNLITVSWIEISVARGVKNFYSSSFPRSRRSPDISNVLFAIADRPSSMIFTAWPSRIGSLRSTFASSRSRKEAAISPAKVQRTLVL